MSKRLAVSIVELLVIMSACSVILTMSAALVHRAMRTQSQARAFYDAERGALRLARQLRRDANNAMSASVNGENAGEGVLLRLQLADRNAVDYRYSSGEVVRELSRPGRAVAREQFPFPSPIDVGVRREDSPPRIIVTLTCKQTGPSSRRQMAADARIEACLGLGLIQGKSP